jgi:YD repeat-containing protein
MISPWGDRFTWGYDNASRSLVQYNSNGTRASYLYDAIDRTQRIAHLQTNGSTIASFDYRYDAVGNKARCIEGNGDRVTWSYDRTYQLIHDHRSGPYAYDVTYSYDPAMNRSVKTSSGARTTSSYDVGDRLRRTQNAAGISTYTYDAAGNQTLDWPSGVRTTFAWDYENRLTAKKTSAGVQTMTYDPDHHRVQRADSGGLTISVWDRENVIQESVPGPAVEQYIINPNQYGFLIALRDPLCMGSQWS